MTKTATVHAQQKWEYCEVTRKTEGFLLDDLNQAGQHGWELVAIAHGKNRTGDDAWTAFLKRPFVPHGDSPKREEEATHALHGETRIEPRRSGS